MSAKTHQVGAHFKALNKALLMAHSQMLENFFPFLSRPVIANGIDWAKNISACRKLEEVPQQMRVSCFTGKHMFCTLVISALHLGYLKNHQRGHLNSSATSGPMKLPSQPNARRDSLREDCSVCSRLLCRSSSDGQQSSQQLACSSQLDLFQVRAECIDFEVTRQ